MCCTYFIDNAVRVCYQYPLSLLDIKLYKASAARECYTLRELMEILHFFQNINLYILSENEKKKKILYMKHYTHERVI